MIAVSQTLALIAVAAILTSLIAFWLGWQSAKGQNFRDGLAILGLVILVIAAGLGTVWLGIYGFLGPS